MIVRELSSLLFIWHFFLLYILKKKQSSNLKVVFFPNVLDGCSLCIAAQWPCDLSSSTSRSHSQHKVTTHPLPHPSTCSPCWSLHAFMWVLGVSTGSRGLGAICHWDEVLTELEAPSHASRRELSLQSACEDVYTQSILMRLRTERQSVTHTGNTHIHWDLAHRP